MTQPQAVAAETCDQFLRQGREFLAQGNLVSASAAGWRAAVLALEAYAGDAVAERDFKDAARALVKDGRGTAKAAEWVVSAITLSENVVDDWLDKDGVGHRLDDVQRLVLLVKDIAEPPQVAEDVLNRSRECLENGYLAPASEKGWEAALWTTKTYADAMGYEYRGDSHFEDVTRILAKEEAGGREAGVRKVTDWEYSALNLRQTASYCTLYPRWLVKEIVSSDVEDVAMLANLVQKLIAIAKSSRLENV